MIISPHEWYWFPWHQGTGVLQELNEAEVQRRLTTILRSKPWPELSLRLQAWQPVKNPGMVEDTIFGDIINILGKFVQRQLRAQYIKEYPENEWLLTEEGLELNLRLAYEGDVKERWREKEVFLNSLFHEHINLNVALGL